MLNRCEFQPCERRSYTKGYCERHYQQVKSGDPLTFIPMGAPPCPAKRLREKAATAGDCLVWTGNIASSGYGRMKVKGREVYVHRVAYELEHGPLPEEMQVDHICRNRACIKLSHLRLATNKQNAENTSLRADNTLGYRGVKREWNRFSVAVQHNGKRYFKYGFATAEAADEYGRALRNQLFTHNEDDRLAG